MYEQSHFDAKWNDSDFDLIWFERQTDTETPRETDIQRDIDTERNRETGTRIDIETERYGYIITRHVHNIKTEAHLQTCAVLRTRKGKLFHRP